MRKAVALAAAVLWGAGAFAQTVQMDAHVGYVYPAGGRRGTTVDVVIGGQRIRDVTDVYVTGGGVHVSSIRYIGQVATLNGDDRKEAVARIVNILSRRGVDMPPALRRLALVSALPPSSAKSAAKTPEQPAAAKKGPARAPVMEALKKIDDLRSRDLQLLIYEMMRSDGKKQRNQQLGEIVFIKLQIDSDAALGDRELRLMTQLGFTNPMRISIGLLPEACAPVTYGMREEAAAPVETPTVTPPVVLNGQIKPGEISRWRLEAQKGQKLLIRAQARALIPFLADAVPGWFQAVVALYDEEGKEVAYADGHEFDQDPILLYEVPRAGEYQLEIRDALNRGRQDFIYRVSVAEEPLVESIFPLGGRSGHRAVASVAGWNLDSGAFKLDTAPGAPDIRQTAVRGRHGASDEVTYAVDDLPETEEREPNDSLAKAQSVRPPIVINGRVQSPGDEDVFKFSGSEGDEIVAEVIARRLGSPLDSLLRLMDASGRVVAWNDDYEDKAGALHMDMSILTHHADSYLRAKLPARGVYYVQISDAQRQGGSQYAYRLRISPPEPDFELAIAPSSVNVMPGSYAQVSLYALRKDGFDGEVEVTPADAAAGVALQGASIPAGCDSVRATLSAAPGSGPTSVRFEARAIVDGKSVVRPVVPCEDMMQAFAWRQLVPSQELVVAVLGRGRRVAAPTLIDNARVRIRAGEDAEVRIAMPRRPALGAIELELNDAPEGITIRDKALSAGGVNLILHAEADKVHPGLKGNLIVEMFTERLPANKASAKNAQKTRLPIGVLPAIPFEIEPKAGAK